MNKPLNLTFILVALAAAGLTLAAGVGGRRIGWWPPHRDELIASVPVTVVPPTPVRLPILVYHNVRPTPARKLSAVDAQYDVTPEEFRAQMAYLKQEGFTPVSFAILADRLEKGDAPWPTKPVIISFDDGRRNQLENALPVLKELGLKATFFVFTNAPDRNDNYFTWEEIRQLERDGHEIGSHTVLHSYLTKADDETLAKELNRAQEDFSAKLGHRVTALAYPFGLTDERVRAATAAAGYRVARALHHEVEVKPGDELDLPGYIVTGDLAKFKRIVAGDLAGK